MKLKDYAKLINDLAKIHPNAKVVYAIDDEGNGYNEVVYAPTYSSYEIGYRQKEEMAVCIN